MIEFDTSFDVRPRPKVVVRLTRNWFAHNGRIVQSVELRILKRKSIGFDYVSEDVSQGGAEYFFKHITNLRDCPDGLYFVTVINESRDWETGYVDDWDYRLDPYKPSELLPSEPTTPPTP